MSKELFVSSTPHETRVAVVEDGQLSEVYYERENEYTLAGSIYKGKVTRVLPGMQSAFVDVGLERDAFLYVSDFFEMGDEKTTNSIRSAPSVRKEMDEMPADRGHATNLAVRKVLRYAPPKQAKVRLRKVKASLSFWKVGRRRKVSPSRLSKPSRRMLPSRTHAVPAPGVDVAVAADVAAAAFPSPEPRIPSWRTVPHRRNRSLRRRNMRLRNTPLFPKLRLRLRHAAPSGTNALNETKGPNAPNGANATNGTSGPGATRSATRVSAHHSSRGVHLQVSAPCENGSSHPGSAPTIGAAAIGTATIGAARHRGGIVRARHAAGGIFLHPCT